MLFKIFLLVAMATRNLPKSRIFSVPFVPLYPWMLLMKSHKNLAISFGDAL